MDFVQMNELCAKFPESLAVLCFPCNQFGDQENCQNAEILNALQHVRPGRGFVPLATMFQKVAVNGSEENPIFINWAPVKRSDISWNFEKFLIHPDGTPVQRYSRYFPTIDIEEDIRKLIAEQ